MVIAAVVWLILKKPVLGMLAGYVFLIITETLLIRSPFEGSHFQPELFWSWRVWNEQWEQIIANILMFIPVGLLAGWFWRWKAMWFAAGLSASIEVLQLITSRGLCEFDDLVHNMIGATVGVGIVMMIDRATERSKNKDLGF